MKGRQNKRSKFLFNQKCLGVGYISLSVYLYLSLCVAIYLKIYLVVHILFKLSSRYGGTFFEENIDSRERFLRKITFWRT